MNCFSTIAPKKLPYFGLVQLYQVKINDNLRKLNNLHSYGDKTQNEDCNWRQNQHSDASWCVWHI